MSQYALLKGVRARIQAVLGIDNAKCDIRFDGMPPASCGELFIAVHPGQWTGTNIEGRQDNVGVEITVTRRTEYAPFDRAVDPMMEALESLDIIVSRIIAALHINYEVLNVANAVLDATAGTHVNGYDVPLRFSVAGRPIRRRGDWFSSDIPSTGHEGVSRTISMENARRFQTVESQT